MHARTTSTKSIWLVVKWIIFAIVLGAVIWHGCDLWNKLDSRSTQLNLKWTWLAAATILAIVGWTPSAFYWRWIVGKMGPCPPVAQALRAYYCGTLGKYLPGKAAVIVVRAAMVKSVGIRPGAASLAVLHETFTFMWAGTVAIIWLYPYLERYLPEWLALPKDVTPYRLLLLVISFAGGSAVLAILLHSHRLLNRLRGGPSTESIENEQARLPATDPIADRPNPADRIEAADEEPIHLSFWQAWRATLVGGALFIPAWWIHGLTLGLTIYAVIGDRISWSDWPFWTGATAISLVGGFVILFAPGGLGVREGLLLELFERQLEPREAVLVTVLWRGVALVSEIVAAGALYYGIDSGERPTQSQPINDSSPANP
jgi:hypothetical protein